MRFRNLLDEVLNRQAFAWSFDAELRVAARQVNVSLAPFVDWDDLESLYPRELLCGKVIGDCQPDITAQKQEEEQAIH